MSELNIPGRKMFIYTTFQKEGYHRYPDADKDPTLATGDAMDVSHLAVRHFHYFNFKVWIEVDHSNRSIEFIQLRRWIETLYTGGALEIDYRSCEHLANELYVKLAERYPNREIRIDISEEGINGAYIEYKLQ
jgi:hypothetical protein